MTNELETQEKTNELETQENTKELETQPETQAVKEKEKETKKKNPLLIIVVLIIIVALLAGAFILGTKFANQENEKETQKMLDVYLYETGEICKKSEENCELIASIPVTNNDAKYLRSYQTTYDEQYQVKFILYKDGNTKIYDVETKKVQETTLDTEYDEYSFQVSYDQKELLGIVIEKYEHEDTAYLAYYDVKNKKVLLENQYDYIYALDGDYLQLEKDPNKNADTLVDNFDWDKYWSEYSTYLYDLKTQKEVIVEQGGQFSYSIEKVNNKVYIYKTYHGLGESVSSVYNEEYKALVKDSYSWGFTEDNNIYKVEDNKVVIINYQGEVISTSKTYNSILYVDGDYILYHDDKNIYITDDKEFNKQLMEWKKDYFFHKMLSRYYDEELVEEGKPAGYYFTIEYDKDDESGVEIYFNPETKETKRYELEEIGAYAKPVLYLYPEEKTEVTINFEKEDNLTTTYPKFKEQWEVTAYPNGDLYDKDGKYYYGLYWEEDSNHTVNFTEGFYVSKDNAIEFLEEKLTIIGLNAKERNEFIMYWLPILEKNEHNLVYFELTEERNAFNEIEISPKPDSLLRIAIHVKKIDKEQSIKEQKLKPFKRTGFTAVEWGGVSYN